MSSYSRGIAVEREIKKLLEDNGWSVMRGAGSKGEVFSEKADLIATRVGRSNIDDVHILVIQAKRKKKKVKKNVAVTTSEPGS